MISPKTDSALTALGSGSPSGGVEAAVQVFIQWVQERGLFSWGLDADTWLDADLGLEEESDRVVEDHDPSRAQSIAWAHRLLKCEEWARLGPRDEVMPENLEQIIIDFESRTSLAVQTKTIEILESFFKKKHPGHTPHTERLTGPQIMAVWEWED